MDSKRKVRIGLDTNMVIYLAQFNNPDLDPDNIIHDLLAKRILSPKIYESVKRINLPPLLQDTFLGEIITMPNGLEIYGNLQDIANLFSLIKKGEVEACITPTVMYEAGKNYITNDFIDNYITVIHVDDEDKVEFYGKRWELAHKYAEAGAIDKVRDAVTLKERITADACITAEFSLCGLNFVTANLKHLVHINVEDADYERSMRIDNTNYQYGLVFTTFEGNRRCPRSLTIGDLMTRLKKLRRGQSYSILDFQDYSIDEEDKYLSH